MRRVERQAQRIEPWHFTSYGKSPTTVSRPSVLVSNADRSFVTR